MAFPERLLSPDEKVVRHMHEHPKALFGNLVALILIVAAVVFALVALPDSLSPWAHWAAIITAIILAVILVIYPALQWLTSTYTITNRRLVTRSGFLSKVGHDVVLSSITKVSHHQDVLDRWSSAGTLTLERTDGAPLELHDVPDIEAVNRELNELLFGSTESSVEKADA